MSDSQPVNEVATPAKQAQNTARAAQELSASHTQTLGGLRGEVTSPEDQAVLDEWTKESKELRTDADRKVRESTELALANVPKARVMDAGGRLLLARDLKEIQAGGDRSSPVGGRVGGY